MTAPILIYLAVACLAAVLFCIVATAGKREEEAWARALDDEDRAREQLGYGHYGYGLTTSRNGGRRERVS